MLFFRYVFFLFLIFGVAISGAVYAEEKMLNDRDHQRADDKPNFTIGLGYGLLDEKSLLNIDLKINIPIEKYFSTQLLLNSNYLITGSASDSFAQSEFFSNWFVHNDYGRLGVGLGYSELEPQDGSLESESEVMGQYIAEMYLGAFTLGGNQISTDTTLSNITSSKFGVSYYIDSDHRVSLYREKYSEGKTGWRLETYFQPKKHARSISIGVIARTSDDYDYLGVTARYFFDYLVPLKERERAFY